MGDFAKVGGVLAAPFTGGASLILTAGAFTMDAVKAQERELAINRRQEEMAATDREVQRQRRLNAIIGAQHAAAAASGVAMSGSVLNLTEVDAKRAAEDSLVDNVNTGQRIRALRQQGRAIRSAGYAQLGSSIMSAGQRHLERG